MFAVCFDQRTKFFSTTVVIVFLEDHILIATLCLAKPYCLGVLQNCQFLSNIGVGGGSDKYIVVIDLYV